MEDLHYIREDASSIQVLKERRKAGRFEALNSQVAGVHSINLARRKLESGGCSALAIRLRDGSVIECVTTVGPVEDGMVAVATSNAVHELRPEAVMEVGFLTC